MSQCTEISISFNNFSSDKYFSKYFICLSNNPLSHLKSYDFFLLSSHTWIITKFLSYTLKTSCNFFVLIFGLSGYTLTKSPTIFAGTMTFGLFFSLEILRFPIDLGGVWSFFSLFLRINEFSLLFETESTIFVNFRPERRV